MILPHPASVEFPSAPQLDLRNTPRVRFFFTNWGFAHCCALYHQHQLTPSPASTTLIFTKWGEQTAPARAEHRQHFERASFQEPSCTSDKTAAVEREETAHTDKHERGRNHLPRLAKKVTAGEKTEEICKWFTLSGCFWLLDFSGSLVLFFVCSLPASQISGVKLRYLKFSWSRCISLPSKPLLSHRSYRIILLVLKYSVSTFTFRNVCFVWKCE